MRKLIGSKAFYAMVFAVLIPIIIQNSISNFVSLLDNLMVGAVGTEEMSGVAIANQLMMVYNLSIFGGLSGAGIFTAQFFGSKNHEGVRETVRIKLMVAAVLTVVFLLIFSFFSENLISLYLSDGEGAGDLQKTLGYGMDYFGVMLWGMLPFAVTNVYASTVRECGKTVLPMKASIAAVLTNLCFNWLLIFGNLGFPTLGVKGAAYATVLSRFVEMAIVVIAAHRNKNGEYAFMEGLYKSFRVRASLVKNVLIKAMPLLCNEFLWSLGVATTLQAYSVRGLAAVAALNISNTVYNLFNVICMSMGSAVAIIVGQALGAGDLDNARDLARKIMAFNVFCGVTIGLVMFFFAPLVPRLYNTTDTVRALAADFLHVSACTMPIFAFLHCCYFTLRSGGKTIITFIFDSGFMWVCSIPLVYCLTRFTGIAILPIYIIVQCADLIKCIVGYIMLKKGVWVHNMAAENR